MHRRQAGKTAPKPAKGQPAPTTAQFKQQCQTEYNGLRDQVLQFLISAQWIVGEAKDQGVKVTDAEVKKQFDTTKKQSFPKEADFQKFLKSSGMALDDLKFRVQRPGAVGQAAHEGDQGQGHRHRRADHRLLQQEQVALRSA